MNYTISNHFLRAVVSSKGAELVSLKKADSNAEYIWKADPNVWGRHAPVLFPIVGRLRQDEYVYSGKTYSLGQHGFAREMEFRNLVNNNDTLIFELQENEDTRLDYPFHFSLQISYHLLNNTLFNKLEVHNTDDDRIYFSLGAHPGFSCPLNEHEQRSDYYLEFEKEESAQSHLLKNGNLSGETKSVISGKTIHLRDDLFDEDALIFKDLQSEEISLYHRSGKRVLSLKYPQFPYLGIWSKSRTSPYVCIEPWFGLADNANHNGDFTEKEGIQWLDPEGVFHCEFGIEIF